MGVTQETRALARAVTDLVAPHGWGPIAGTPATWTRVVDGTPCDLVVQTTEMARWVTAIVRPNGCGPRTQMAERFRLAELPRDATASAVADVPVRELPRLAAAVAGAARLAAFREACGALTLPGMSRRSGPDGALVWTRPIACAAVWDGGPSALGAAWHRLRLGAPGLHPHPARVTLHLGLALPSAIAPATTPCGVRATTEVVVHDVFLHRWATLLDPDAAPVAVASDRRVALASEALTLLAAFAAHQTRCAAATAPLRAALLAAGCAPARDEDDTWWDGPRGERIAISIGAGTRALEAALFAPDQQPSWYRGNVPHTITAPPGWLTDPVTYTCWTTALPVALARLLADSYAPPPSDQGTGGLLVAANSASADRAADAASDTA